ncbi:LysR family transcriptional regulator [Sulfuriroseicoccus oceanibius]|uniref:LysR family transcriptional regulator n=1 Tax=Sulfuriroseicoccus oceanibius TaxID=2707525 RepID=A0A6B3L4A4_9BACT|nr:LysR substrate-binding domain-containing protein [Sulfuriroseicoccus oceanibius]QQL44907.1 LysR family transcriptional regulator [Sulfuriroseicoccus oceanibius]
MEIRQLEYFVALVEEKTFSAAAARCGVAQPSLSQQIKKLELELGADVVVRRRSGVELTAAGKLLWRRAAAILGLVGDVERLFLDRGELIAERVTVGAIPTIAPYWLPEILRQMRARFPEVSIDLVEDETVRLLELVLAGDVDFAITSDMDVDVSGLIDRRLFDEPLWLTVAADSELAQSDVVDVERLKEEALLVMQEGHCLTDQTVRQCRARDFKPRTGIRCSSLETLVGLIEAGLGVGFIPEMARAVYGKRAVRMVEVAAGRFSRSVRIVSRADKVFAPHERRLVELITEHVETGGGNG